MEDLHILTEKVGHIAREGGTFLREARLTFDAHKVETKHTHDYVSYVDRESERQIVDKLKILLPEAGFITEEGTIRTNEERQLKWVIDPLDGTTNFIRDNAPYCISIALCSNKEILLGVVYEVCRDELYAASKDGPSTLNGHPIRVSGISSMEDAYAILELPYNTMEYKATGAHLYDRLYGTAACLRMPGSAAAAMCYVAAGRFDIWFESFIGRWDYMGAALIVKQAGGKVTNFFGSEDILNINNIVATNALLHDKILDWLGENMPKGLK